MLLIFIILITIWLTTDITNNGLGTNCSNTTDCAYGLICRIGKCSNLEFTSCDVNNDMCPLGTKCIDGICKPIIFDTL